MPDNIFLSRRRLTTKRNPDTLTSRIYVGILSSHALAADYLVALVKQHDNMIPIALTDGVASARALPKHSCVVIVIDLWGLPLPASEYLKAFTFMIPSCSFLALDRNRNGTDVAQFLRLGFAGFSSYENAAHYLGPAINAIAAGDVWASSEAVRIYMDLTSQRAGAQGVTAQPLTAREAQVLDLLRKRYSNKEMASWLRVSESTVKFHVSHVLTKLNVSNRRALADNRLILGPTALSS
jgi:DNA-binding NarL/FixJ family response regulator